MASISICVSRGRLLKLSKEVDQVTLIRRSFASFVSRSRREQSEPGSGGLLVRSLRGLPTRAESATWRHTSSKFR